MKPIHRGYIARMIPPAVSDDAPAGRPALAAWRPWLLALAVLVGTLAACFPEAVTGRATVDGAARLTFIDPLYEPVLPQVPRMLADTSTEMLHQPWDAWIVRTMKGGDLPLWLPDNGFGAPIMANGQTAVFSPYKWLMLGPTDGAWSTAFVLGRLALAGAGALLLARWLGLSPLAGLLGACAFMLHGFFLLHLRFPEVHVYAFLPWALLAAERLRRTPDVRGIGLMGLAIGVTGLLGHPEPALYTATAAGLVYAASVLADGEQVGRRALAMALAVGLGALLNMVVLVPFFEFVRESQSYLFENRNALHFSFKHLVVFSISQLLIPNGPRLAYEHFVGVAPLALALLGLGRSAVRVPGLVLCGLGVLAYLVFPPTNVVPTLPLSPNSFYAPPLLALGFALLAAAGLDALLAAPRARAVLLVGLATGGVALLVARYQLFAPFKTFGDLSPALPFLGALALVLGSQRLRAWPRPLLAGALLGLTALHLGLAARTVVVPLPAFRYPETPIVAHLKAQPGLFRSAGGDGAFLPDTNLMHGLASAEHVDAFYLRRYASYWNAARRDLPKTGYQPDLLDLANVRYLVVSGLPRGDGLRRQLAKDPARYPRRVTQRRAELHENLTALPRARVLHAAEFVPLGSPEAVRRLTMRPAAWRQAALLETPDGRPPAGWRDTPGPVTPVEVATYTARRVELTTQLDRPGVLVLADQYARGWTAEVDGREAEIYPADVAFRGVLLDPGQHRVVFRYEPRSVTVGMALSLLALLLCLLAIAWPRPGAPRGPWRAPWLRI